MIKSTYNLFNVVRHYYTAFPDATNRIYCNSKGGKTKCVNTMFG